MSKIKDKPREAEKKHFCFQSKNFNFLNSHSKFKKLSNSVKRVFIMTILTIGFIVLAALPLGAVDIPLISKEIAIPREGNHPFGFGTVPQHETTTLLEITSRLNSSTQGGSTAILKIMLNGHEVRVARSRQGIRLVNKPLMSKVAETMVASWFAEDRAWRVIYAPDFECGRKVPFYEGDPYTLVLDVTDLCNPAAENRLELINLATKNWNWLKPNEGELIVQRLKISTKPGASPMMIPEVDTKPIINRGQPAAGPAEYRGKIMPGGGFIINIGKQQWNFASAFSYPNAGLNRLQASDKVDTSGQDGWKMRVQPSNDGGEVFAESPDYLLHRSVRFTSRKIEIKDTLTNRHQSPLGFLISHNMSIKGIEAPIVRLAGNPDPAVKDYYSPGNPSVHVSLPGQGIGLLCEDDVFRNQARLFVDSSTVGIRTEMFRLGPEKSYTLEWSVYPVAGPDYFDFINLVRQDWGANFTVDGPWTIVYPDQILVQPIDELRAQLAHQGIKYAITIGPWITGSGSNERYVFGLGGLEDSWANHRRKLRETAARVRKASPEVKILVYYNSTRDTSKGSHEKFRDSWYTDAQGKQLSTNWGIPGNDCYTLVPTLKNSFGKAMLASVDRYISETDSDSIYWDEPGGCEYFGIPSITYNQFDGYSCLLDLKQYTIKREIGLTGLLENSFLRAVVDRVRSQGRPLLGNGPCSTRALLTAGMQRMTEVQHNDFWCYEGNLGSPLGWTYTSSSNFDGTTRTLRMGCLPVGVPLPSEHEISRYLFPFTPIELHHAYLLGEERIITLHDGNYGWIGKRCLVQLHHFNRNGKLIKDDTFTLIGKEARTAVKLAEEEAIVLERLPLVFEPNTETSTWNAKAGLVSYKENAISLQLDAPEGGVLKINSGKFSLKDGTSVAVFIGDKSQSLKVENSTLRINVPVKFDGNIRIMQKEK